MDTILIVGGGAGGLELATKLGRKLGKSGQAEIVLVDKYTSHIWKPLLHEVASGSLDTSTDGVAYSAHGARHHYQFQQGEMVGLDTATRQIVLAPILDETGRVMVPGRALDYDKLILAVGSVSNDFGTPGVAEHCYFLDTPAQAAKFHRSLIHSFVRVNQDKERRDLHIAIVGGGATGVELSAELYHAAALARRYGLPRISAERLKISLLEAGPGLVPALPKRISDVVRKELIRLGVEVLENTRVASAVENGLFTQDGRTIRADLMVWAAGVKAPDFIRELGLFELNRLQQIIVTPELLAKGHLDIFVLGDCCGYQQEDDSWVPPRAQAAHQMASLIADNLLRQRQNKPMKPYVYKDHGSLVNLSRYSTVGNLMGNLTGNTLFIEGRIARFVYISLYRMHQVAIHGWLNGMLMILVEKLNRAVRPKLKLH